MWAYCKSRFSNIKLRMMSADFLNIWNDQDVLTSLMAQANSKMTMPGFIGSNCKR